MQVTAVRRSLVLSVVIEKRCLVWCLFTIILTKEGGRVHGNER